jgi:hypothetical protein
VPGLGRAWQHVQTAVSIARLILLIPCWDGLRADPEEKQGLAKNIEHWGAGQLGSRLTSTRRIEKSRHLVERVEPEALRLA